MATLPVAYRNELVDLFSSKWDLGSGQATIQCRNGVKPAATSDAATGTLLVTFTLSDPGWAGAVAGVANLDVTPAISALGVAAGTVTWARVIAPDGSVACDLVAGAAGAGVELVFDNPVIAIGQTVNLTVGTITQPA